jgi:predicted nucleic acid-binding protein
MGRIVLDTDVASRSFKRELPPTLLRKLIGSEPSITFITQGELTKWSTRRHWGARRQERMARWLDGMPVIHSTDDISHLWGELAAFAEQRGRPRPVNDSWIAACCLAYDLPLATFNVKDFEDFAEYEGLSLVTA